MGEAKDNAGDFLAVPDFVVSNVSALTLSPSELQGLLGSTLFNFVAILFISALFAELVPARGKLLRLSAFLLAMTVLSYLVFSQGRPLYDALVIIAVTILSIVAVVLKLLAGVAPKAIVAAKAAGA